MIFGVWLFALFIVLLLFFAWSGRSASKPNSLGIECELLYADQGRKSRAFVSRRYGIRAKPDFLIKLKDGRIALVEYKSRSNDRIYESDIVQAKASVLAAREAYPVEVMFIKTNHRLKAIPIPRDSDVLYREILRHVELARRAQRGELLGEYTANVNQCQTCSVRAGCQR